MSRRNIRKVADYATDVKALASQVRALAEDVSALVDDAVQNTVLARLSSGKGAIERVALSAMLDAASAVLVRLNGTDVGTRRILNLIAGSGVTLTVTDDGTNEEVDITVASSITSYTDEQAQDAVGAMVNSSLTYVDGTPLLHVSDGDKGAIVVSGSGTVWALDADSVKSTHIEAGAVANSDIRDSAGLSVLGRSANSTGSVADITAGTDGHILRRSGTTLGFGTIVMASISDLPTLAAGVWTPTLTGVANVTSSTAYEGQYMRVGATVTCSCKIEVTATAGETLTQLGVSLPVASNFGAEEDCAGTAVPSNDLAAYIVGDASNNRAELKFAFPSSGSYTFFTTFTYQVI